jgi:hypothetical protein
VRSSNADICARRSAIASAAIATDPKGGLSLAEFQLRAAGGPEVQAKLSEQSANAIDCSRAFDKKSLPDAMQGQNAPLFGTLYGYEASIGPRHRFAELRNKLHELLAPK